jgi:hypothetical protein
VLTDAALATARTPTPLFGAGQYWYVRERGVQLGTDLDQAGLGKRFFKDRLARSAVPQVWS